jgi:hypothetical protein
MVCDLRDLAANQMAGVSTREFSVMATNLLNDPNFDLAGLTEWDTNSPGASDIQWSSADPSSQASGVAVIETLDGAGEMFWITQCLSVSEGTPYALAGISRIDSSVGDMPILNATVSFFRNAGCTDLLESVDAVVAQGDTGGAWQPRLFAFGRAPSEALSAQVGFVVDGGTAQDFSVHLDETTFFENLIFADGFETGDVDRWSTSQP